MPAATITLNSARPITIDRRAVILFGGGIGEHLMILPALRALAELFPQKLAWMGFPPVLKDLYLDVHFTAVYTDCMRKENGKVKVDVNRASQVLREDDLLISLCTWFSSEIDELLTTVPDVTTLGHYPQFHLFNRVEEQVHLFDSGFRLVQEINPQFCLEDYAQPPLLKEVYRYPARQLKKALPEGSKVLVVHADTKPEKMWPVERMRANLDFFLSQHPEYVVWVVGRQDLQINSGQHAGRIRLYLNLPLGAALALVSEADLFLGIDSCMLHAADLFRVPGIALFGPTSPAERGFRFTRHVHLDGRGSLSNIQVSEVIDALECLNIPPYNPGLATLAGNYRQGRNC